MIFWASQRNMANNTVTKTDLSFQNARKNNSAFVSTRLLEKSVYDFRSRDNLTYLKRETSLHVLHMKRVYL